jgi:hypothetical protein
MSESLPIANDSPPNRKEASQNPKVVMITAVMTAITTIAVSLIGIVPQFRSNYVLEINKLTAERDALRDKAALPPAPALPGKKQTIEGRATRLDGNNEALNGMEVYLVPAGNLLTATTNEDGSFNFNDIPAGVYSIFLRDSTQGKSGRKLLVESEHELSFKWVGARVNYHITPSH